MLAVVPVSSSAALPALTNRPALLVHGGRNSQWSSSNWSGFAVTAKAPYTAVTAKWTVPSVTATKVNTYSSDWVGIDGFTNQKLIQTGTESDYYGGAAHYDAWWEILPASETVISGITVRPGDVMTASITKLSSGSWNITITDTTTGKSFSSAKAYKGPGASAEWVVERPSLGSTLATLAHYKSPVTFDPGTANGASPAFTASNGGYMLNNAGTKHISSPSAPDSDHDGFNCSYGAIAPSPPSS
jgi:hypothetical protein